MIRSFKTLTALSVAVVMLFGCVAFAGESYELRDLLWSGTMNSAPALASALPDHELLRTVMEGGFDREDDDLSSSLKLQTLASAMPQLAGVPQEELRQFAAAYQLPENVVLVAYYLALANAVRADIRVNPAPAGTYAELQKQMTDLLGEYDDDDEERELSMKLTPEAAAVIAAGYGLPVEFVLFIADHDMHDDINDLDDFDETGDDDDDMDDDEDEDDETGDDDGMDENDETDDADDDADDDSDDDEGDDSDDDEGGND